MIIRTYQCLDCQTVFEFQCESNDGDPDCPTCETVLEWRPQSFNIGTIKSKAIDYTQQVLEQDYGVTNFKDQQREGDTAGMSPVETKDDRNAQDFMNEQVRKALNSSPVAAAMAANDPATAAALKNPNLAPQMKAFWGNTGGIGMNVQAAMAGAKTGPYAGTDPMAMLHKSVNEAGDRADLVKSTPPLAVHRGK